VKAQQYVQHLISRGIWTFTSNQIAHFYGIDPKDKIHALKKAGKIISPARGFYVIVPEEFIPGDRLPVTRYIDDLMKYFGQSYYVGLLAAASHFGAAHQSPMQFQVITALKRRSILVRKSKILFYKKKNITDIPVIRRKTATGYFNLSPPAVTFFDMILYNRHIGGLENVLQVTTELIDSLSGGELVQTAPHYPNAVVQRGGYILEILGVSRLCSALADYLRPLKPIYAYLNPSKIHDRTSKSLRWKLILNEPIELEI
jgi:hypothetical protein